MARFQHLPLFQKCYSFSKEVYQLKLKLPQNLKHDLGSDLFKSALKSTKLVILANGSENKERALKELFLEVQVIWVWLRLLVDLKAISTGQFKELSERLADIEKQVSTWMSWDKKQRKLAGQSEAVLVKSQKG
jgi:hypothetical protein